jgi:hypothetical protein
MPPNKTVRTYLVRFCHRRPQARLFEVRSGVKRLGKRGRLVFSCPKHLDEVFESLEAIDVYRQERSGRASFLPVSLCYLGSVEFQAMSGRKSLVNFGRQRSNVNSSHGRLMRSARSAQLSCYVLCTLPRVPNLHTCTPHLHNLLRPKALHVLEGVERFGVTHLTWRALIWGQLEEGRIRWRTEASWKDMVEVVGRKPRLSRSLRLTEAWRKRYNAHDHDNNSWLAPKPCLVKHSLASIPLRTHELELLAIVRT